MLEGFKKMLCWDRERPREGDGSKDQSRPDAGVPAGVLVLGNTSFTSTIRKYPLSVVDFWAPWCAPCRAVSPVIEQLSKEYAGRVAFGKVNVDKEKWLASSYQVRSIPTVMIFSRGHAVARVVGAVPKHVVESKMRLHLGGGASDRSR